MEKAFKAGDVVQLKSGGPKMTVEGYAAMIGSVICTWFVAGKKHQDTFEEGALQMWAEQKTPAFPPVMIERDDPFA